MSYKNRAASEALLANRGQLKTDLAEIRKRHRAEKRKVFIPFDEKMKDIDREMDLELSKLRVNLVQKYKDRKKELESRFWILEAEIHARECEALKDRQELYEEQKKAIKYVHGVKAGRPVKHVDMRGIRDPMPAASEFAMDDYYQGQFNETGKYPDDYCKKILAAKKEGILPLALSKVCADIEQQLDDDYQEDLAQEEARKEFHEQELEKMKDPNYTPTKRAEF